MAIIKGYIAKVGMNFEGLKPPVRVEVGDHIPASVPEKEMEQLLKDGHIEEVKPEAAKDKA